MVLSPVLVNNHPITSDHPPLPVRSLWAESWRLRKYDQGFSNTCELSLLLCFGNLLQHPGPIWGVCSTAPWDKITIVLCSTSGCKINLHIFISVFPVLFLFFFLHSSAFVTFLNEQKSQPGPVFCKPTNQDAAVGVQSVIAYGVFNSKVLVRWFLRWKCTRSTETDFTGREESKSDFSGGGEDETA